MVIERDRISDSFGKGKEDFTMKTYFVIFFIISILLVVVHVFKPVFRRFISFLVFFLLAIVLANVCLNVLASYVQVERESPMDKIVRGINEKYSSEVDIRKVLVVGSSYTSRGVDGAFLEKKLRENIGEVTIFQLSYPGINAYEQDYFIDRLFASGLRFDTLVIELGSEGVVNLDQENQYKSNVIRYHDWARFNLLLRTALFDGDNVGILKRSELVMSHIRQFMAMLFNLGFINQLQPVNEVESILGYQPEAYIGFKRGAEDPKKQDFSGVLKDYPTTSQFRVSQVEKLKRFGVNQVIFFQPPFGFLGKRRFTTELCTLMGGDCILSDEVIGELDLNEYWTDDNHLSKAGAELYSHWLAFELEKHLRTNNAF